MNTILIPDGCCKLDLKVRYLEAFPIKNLASTKVKFMSYDKFLNLNDLSVLVDLERALKSKEAVLFIGAGCSCAIGFPSWKALLAQLNNDLCSSKVIESGKDALSYAKEIKDHIKTNRTHGLEDYYSFMRSKFKNPPMKGPVALEIAGTKTIIEEWPESEFHKQIFEVPFKAFVTTNYDPAIEAYSRKYKEQTITKCVPQEKGEVGDFLFNLHKSNLHQTVYHLHGRYERPEEIILCKDDYEKAYKSKDGPEPIHKKSMWALFTTRPVIFAGFSLEDEYFVEILDSICTDTWSKFGTAKHFALMPFYPHEIGSKEQIRRDSFKERVEQNYGVKVVYYDPSGNHIDLCTLMLLDSEEGTKNGTKAPTEANIVGSVPEVIKEQSIGVAMDIFKRFKR